MVQRIGWRKEKLGALPTIIDIEICGMDVPTLKLVLRPKVTVSSVCNTGETGDINLFSY